MDIVPITENLYDKLQIFCDKCNNLGYTNNSSFKAMKLEWCKDWGEYYCAIKNNEIIEINNNTNNLFIDYENITNLNNKNNNINNNYIGRLNEISQRLSINPPQFVKLNNSIILKWNNKSIIEKNLSTDIKLMIIKQKLAKQLYDDHNL